MATIIFCFSMKKCQHKFSLSMRSKQNVCVCVASSGGGTTTAMNIWIVVAWSTLLALSLPLSSPLPPHNTKNKSMYIQSRVLHKAQPLFDTRPVYKYDPAPPLHFFITVPYNDDDDDDDDDSRWCLFAFRKINKMRQREVFTKPSILLEK